MILFLIRSLTINKDSTFVNISTFFIYIIYMQTMEETNKTEMNESMKTVDIENKSAKDIFAQVYGKDVIKQADETNNDLFKKTKLEKSKSGFVNRGLDVDTNARLSVFAKESVFPNDWTESTMNLLEAWRTA